MINCSWHFYGQDRTEIKVKKFWTNGIGGCKDGWQTVSQVIEVPEGAKSLNLMVTSYADRKFKHAGGTMFIKQVSLTPVPGDASGKKN